MNAPKPRYEYRIRVEGPLPSAWQNWFNDMTILQTEEGTLLVGCLPDNSALQGVLTHLASLNLALISVERKPIESQEDKK